MWLLRLLWERKPRRQTGQRNGRSSLGITSLPCRGVQPGGVQKVLTAEFFLERVDGFFAARALRKDLQLGAEAAVDRLLFGDVGSEGVHLKSLLEASGRPTGRVSPHRRRCQLARSKVRSLVPSGTGTVALS